MAMDLDLHVGSMLHLEIPPGGDKSVARLIGLVPGSSLLITMPEAPGRPMVTVAEGENVHVRAFSGETAMTFASVVTQCHTRPYPYLHLEYPATVDLTPTRNAPRARIYLLGTAQCDQSPGREIPITLHDLSTLGAMVWADERLGSVGESMLLRLPLESDPLGAHMAEVAGEIRNVHEDFGPPRRRWGYGVEFSAMSNATALALRALVVRELNRSLR